MSGPSPDAPTIGVDIGGTKVSAGVVAHDGTILDRARQVTPHRSTAPSVVEDAIVAVIAELMQRRRGGEAPVAGVGIGAAGFVSADGSTVVFAPHLSWRDEPLRASVSERVRLPIIVEGLLGAGLLVRVNCAHAAMLPRLPGNRSGFGPAEPYAATVAGRYASTHVRIRSAARCGAPGLIIRWSALSRHISDFG